MKNAFCVRAVVAIALLASVGACSSWATSNVSGAAGTAARPATTPDKILVVEGDITDRPYTSLGDVSVTVNKTTLFNADPTRAMVNEKLKAEAAKLGADAVIQVRYGNVGVGLMSWGSLDGKGRAIVFTNAQ
jgi:hypothetical protein